MLVYFVGSRLIWKKIEDMDPNLTQRLSVQNHSLVIVFTFLWPLVLAVMFATKENLCTIGSITYFVCFGVPALWSIGVQVKHNKFTRNSLGYLLIFLPGFAGWFMFPLVAVNCKAYTLQAWIIFACYPLFGLLSGARFVKFYDVRHPEQLAEGEKKEKDYGFITVAQKDKDSGVNGSTSHESGPSELLQNNDLKGEPLIGAIEKVRKL